jgi:hypothetical protein
MKKGSPPFSFPISITHTHPHTNVPRHEPASRRRNPFNQSIDLLSPSSSSSSSSPPPPSSARRELKARGTVHATPARSLGPRRRLSTSEEPPGGAREEREPLPSRAVLSISSITHMGTRKDGAVQPNHEMEKIEFPITINGQMNSQNYPPPIIREITALPLGRYESKLRDHCCISPGEIRHHQ